MAISWVSEQRDAQGRIVALPPYDVILGASRDAKPLVDQAGGRLRVESRFTENDTGCEFRWDGTQWVVLESIDRRLARNTLAALQDIHRVLRQVRNATGSQAWGKIGDSLPDE